MGFGPGHWVIVVFTQHHSDLASSLQSKTHLANKHTTVLWIKSYLVTYQSQPVPMLSIRTFVCTLPQLFVVRSLLHKVQDGLGQRGVGEWVGLWVHLSISLLEKKIKKDIITAIVYVRLKQNKQECKRQPSWVNDISLSFARSLIVSRAASSFMLQPKHSPSWIYLFLKSLPLGEMLHGGLSVSLQLWIHRKKKCTQNYCI